MKKPKTKSERLMEEADHRCRNPKLDVSRADSELLLRALLDSCEVIATTDFPDWPRGQRR